MSKRNHQPIRMCISCRKREPQQELYRLQKEESIVIKYSGVGRSFYLCKECLTSKHIEKKIAGRMKLNISSVEELIKELSSNVKNQD